MKTIINITKIQEEALADVYGIHTNTSAKRVFCITTGEIFASVSDAAQANNVTQSFMSHAIKNAHRGATCHKKRFCFMSDILVYMDEFLKQYREIVNYEAVQKIKKQEENAIILERIQMLEVKLLKRREEYDELMQSVEKKTKQIKLLEQQIADLKNKLED